MHCGSASRFGLVGVEDEGGEEDEDAEEGGLGSSRSRLVPTRCAIAEDEMNRSFAFRFYSTPITFDASALPANS